jgi:hypothetical protein
MNTKTIKKLRLFAVKGDYIRIHEDTDWPWRTPFTGGITFFGILKRNDREKDVFQGWSVEFKGSAAIRGKWLILHR